MVPYCSRKIWFLEVVGQIIFRHGDSLLFLGGGSPGSLCTETRMAGWDSGNLK